MCFVFITALTTDETERWHIYAILHYTPVKTGKMHNIQIDKNMTYERQCQWVSSFWLCWHIKMYLHLHLIEPKNAQNSNSQKTTSDRQSNVFLVCNWIDKKMYLQLHRTKPTKTQNLSFQKNYIWMENECVPCFNCVDRKMYLQLHRIKPAKCTACDIQSDSDDVWSTRIPDKCWLDARAVRFYRIRGKFSPHLCCQGGKCNQNPWIWGYILLDQRQSLLSSFLFLTRWNLS